MSGVRAAVVAILIAAVFAWADTSLLGFKWGSSENENFNWNLIDTCLGRITDCSGNLTPNNVTTQPATTDLKDVLVTYHFLTDGGASPLNLDGGTLTAGVLDSVAVAVDLTSDDQVVPVTTTNLVLSSNNGTASNRTAVLGCPTKTDGQLLFITWNDTVASKAELLDDALCSGATQRVRLNGDWIPTQYDTLTLVSQGGDWQEVARMTTARQGFYGITPITQQAGTVAVTTGLQAASGVGLFANPSSGTSQPIGPTPDGETLLAGATIKADACGSIKRVGSASPITTSTSNTFATPAAANKGCVMAVCNTATNAITLDANAFFATLTGDDVVLEDTDDCVVVASDGESIWRQLTHVLRGAQASIGAQTIAAGGTITADNCGGVKDISAAGPTFTAPGASNRGCVMAVCNTSANAITLDNNANFHTTGGGNITLTDADDCVLVGSNGTIWRQLAAVLAGS